MGLYWGPRIAARDRRVKAMVAALGCYMEKDTIFNSAPPLFKKNYMYMAGLQDEAAFDRMAGRMTLEGMEDRIRCATLLVMGQYEQLCSLDDAYRLFDRLPGPKEIWVYENEVHPLGSVAAEMDAMATDWLRDALDGKVPAGHARKVFIPAR